MIFAKTIPSIQQLGYIICAIKKKRIRETKNLSTDADSSTDTKILLVRQNLPKKKPLFFAQKFYTLYEQKLSNLRPLLSLTFPQGVRKSKKFNHWTSENGGKKTFKRSEQMRKILKKLFSLRRFYTLYEQKLSNMRPLISITFPMNSENIKSLDIELWEVGAKRR